MRKNEIVPIECHSSVNTTQTQAGVISGVVVPGEVGILLIYVPNFFFKGPAKDERPVSNSDM